MLERKVVTALFADLVGSTALAGEVDAEQLRDVMARYRDAVAAEVRRFGGTMEKFIGDAAMAVFGSPQTHEDDPERALRCAFAIRDAVRRLENGKLDVRVGLYTGEVVADTAAGERGEFLVTGEAVHLAQRLQAAAGPGEILIGARTWKDTNDNADFEELPALTVKGAVAPLASYRAVRLRETPAPRLPATVSLVGRTFELALLQLLFDKVCWERRPHLLTIIGPPGIGKTRLVEDFRARLTAREPPPVVRTGICKPYGEAWLYCPIGGLVSAELPDELDRIREPGPFFELLSENVRRVFSECALPEVSADRVARILASCLRDDCPCDPPPRRDELLRAWRFALEARSLRAPVFVALDNLQWSSDEPLDFIESLPSKLPDRPILVIAVARQELLERRPRWGGGSGNATTLQLGPLSAEETRALVGELLDAPVDPSLVVALEQRAEGNPHFVIEFVRALVEDGTLARSERDWRLRAGGATLPLPDTVQGAVAARIDRLPALEKRLLLLSSYAGYSGYFYDRPVRRMGDLSEAEVDAGIEALAAKELIKEMVPAGLPGAFGLLTDTRQFAFSHRLLREVARDMVPKAERPRLHVAFAGWLEDVMRELPDAGSIPQIVAHHYFEAWRLASDRGQADPALAERALRYCLRAAELRASCHATREAAEDLRHAAQIARVALPAREGEVAARLLEMERTPVEPL